MTNILPHKSTFESVTELVKACLATPAHPGNVDLLTNTSHSGFICADRREITTYPQALEALASPQFHAGVDRVESLAKKITVPTPHSIKRRVVRGDHGDELDMQRVWQGALDTAWSRAKRTNTAGASRVCISVHGSDNGGVSAEAIAWRGVAALALADALEAAGYTVSVRSMIRAMYHPRSGNQARYALDVTIKGDGDPLDMHKAANLVASTCLFRGAIFRHLIVTASQPISSGLGHNDFRAPEPVAGYDYNCEVTAAIRDARSAQAWIEAQVEALDATHSTDNS